MPKRRRGAIFRPFTLVVALALLATACAGADQNSSEGSNDGNLSDRNESSVESDVAGPESGAEMPDVVGLTEADALEALAGAGLQDDVETKDVPSLEPSGQVLSQLPEAGETVRGTVVISVAVSLPSMPDYVGKQADEVRSELEGWGVNVTIEQVVSEERPEGEVLGTTPSVDAKIGSDVVLEVASEPTSQGLSDGQLLVESYFTDNLSAVAVNGETIPEALGSERCRSGSASSWEFNIGRDWDTFEATVGLTDNSKSSAGQARFKVVVDNEVRWEQIVGFGQAVDVSANVKDGLRLTLLIEPLNDGCAIYVWGSPQLTGSAQTE